MLNPNDMPLVSPQFASGNFKNSLEFFQEKMMSSSKNLHDTVKMHEPIQKTFEVIDENEEKNLNSEKNSKKSQNKRKITKKSKKKSKKKEEKEQVYNFRKSLDAQKKNYQENNSENTHRGSNEDFMNQSRNKLIHKKDKENVKFSLYCLT